MARITLFLQRYFHALGGCIYLFCGGFLSRNHRPLVRAINQHFGYDCKLFPPSLPKVSVADVVLRDIAIQLREESAALGNISLLELVVINKLTRKQEPKEIFEIGTFDGRTTLNMAANAADAKVFTLDLPRDRADSTKFRLNRSDRFCVEKERSGARFIGSDCEPRIQQIFGDSATYDYGPHRNRTDLVFIDGAHSCDYVLSDSRNALSLLRQGKGMLIWHDYNVWDGVTQALNMLFSEGGVFRNLRQIEGTSLAILVL